MDHSLAWDIAKFLMMAIIIPFGVWVVKAHMDTRKEISTMKEAALKFKAEVADKYAPKQDMTNFIGQIDTKINAMQTAVTQRIDTMQSNIATMIASINKKG